jgi:pimeloyl-ACP methyl ester carboxylesterase
LKQLEITYKSSRIKYIRFGDGPREIFCFHGYGEDGSSFSFLEKYAGSQYTFFAMDLPFHGDTQWNDGLSFTTNDLLLIIEKILAENNKQSVIDTVPFTLMGYSLGGRIALSLYEKVPSRIEKIILLAPDGLKVNFWYWLSTQTWIGNKLFAFTMKHPRWFFGFLKMLNKLKLVNASIFKFVNYYIGDENIRQLLYNRWTSLRKLKPNLRSIKLSIQHNNTPLRLIYGKHDRIIRPGRGEKFMQGIEKNSNLLVIHSGHKVLEEKHAQEILPALLY